MYRLKEILKLLKLLFTKLSEAVDELEPEEVPEEEEEIPELEPEEVPEEVLPENVIDGYTYIHTFDHAVVTEYYVGDNCNTQNKIGCMGTVLTENYSCASHNMPCGTKLYIPSLKGVVNDTGLFEVEDTGGHAFDFDIFTGGDSRKKVGKQNREVYVLEWGQKKLTCSYTYIINYFKEQGRFENYRAAWELYKKMDGQVIKFYQFNDEDKNLDIDNL